MIIIIKIVIIIIITIIIVVNNVGERQKYIRDFISWFSCDVTSAQNPLQVQMPLF